MSARKARPTSTAKGGPPTSSEGGTPRPSKGAPPARAGAPLEDAPPAPSRRAGLLTPRQAADLLQLSESTLKRMRLRETGPTFIRFGDVVRYHPRDIAAFIKDNRIVTTSNTIES